MKCLKLLLIIGWGLLSQASFLKAQESILDNYIQEGIENNLALKQQSFDIQKSLAALGEAKGLFFPDVSFQASYTLAGGGRTISLPLGDLLNPAYTALNDLTNSSNFPTLENSNEQFLPNNFHETKIRVVQPLFNSDIYFNYKAKEKLISVEKARQEVFIQELRKDIKVAYLQYLQTLEVIHIYDETEEVLKEVLRVNQKLVKNNQATPEIVYGAEAELSQLASDRAEADNNRQATQSYFNFLLNRDLESDIQVDSSKLNLGLGALDLNGLQDQALASRPEFDQLESARQANQELVKLNQFSKYPKLNLAGDIGYQGFGYTFDSDQ
ncbi:MAG: TolC family protein, partial [Bacteroidota bacterium]